MSHVVLGFWTFKETEKNIHYWCQALILSNDLLFSISSYKFKKDLRHKMILYWHSVLLRFFQLWNCFWVFNLGPFSLRATETQFKLAWIKKGFINSREKHPEDLVSVMAGCRYSTDVCWLFYSCSSAILSVGFILSQFLLGRFRLTWSLGFRIQEKTATTKTPLSLLSAVPERSLIGLVRVICPSINQSMWMILSVDWVVMWCYHGIQNQRLLESLLKNNEPLGCEVFSNYFHSRDVIRHIFLDRIQLVFISPLDLTFQLKCVYNPRM